MDAAKEIASKIDLNRQRLILITASQKFVYLPATLRTLTTAEGALENQAFLSYGDVLKGRGEIKYAKVEAIEPSRDRVMRGGRVRLEGGERVRYDVLILATGSRWAGAINFPREEVALKEHLKTWRTKIEKAKSIVFVGGGIVAVGEVFPSLFLLRDVTDIPHFGM